MRLHTDQVSSYRGCAARGIRVIAVTSGKGGVGKTQVAVNLASALAERGKSTLLLDADLGLANVDVLLGLKPQANLKQVLDGELPLGDVIIELSNGLKVVPAASGVSSLANLSAREQCGLIGAFSELESDVDFMILDTATGADSGVLGFCGAASEVIVMLCDDPASITDAYALIKLLSRERGVTRFRILCNRVRNAMHGRVLFEKFLAVCDRFLTVSLCHVGSIPEDSGVRLAGQMQRALVDFYPSSPAALALKDLAVRADSWNVLDESAGRPIFFLERMLASGHTGPNAEAC